MEAELLAIDGYYQTAEQIPDEMRTRPVQALLDGNVMRIAPLS
jgi:septum site-determining protein MinC